MHLRLILFLFFVTPVSLLIAQPVYNIEDNEIFIKYCTKFSSQANSPIGELVVSTALYFLDKPYIAGTLEQGEKENIVINLREFDCTTFDETVLALVKTIKEKDCSFHKFIENIEQLRYRNGKCSDYPSRLHYFSDWIYDNDRRKNIVDISKSLKFTPLTFNVNFMSKNPEKYSALKIQPNFVKQIQKQEKEINSRNYFFIPKNDLNKFEKYIQNGDIIAIVTSTSGLDIAHVGLAFYQKNKLYFIHASQKYGKVVINPNTLQEYLNQAKSRKGIMIARSSLN